MQIDVNSIVEPYTFTDVFTFISVLITVLTMLIAIVGAAVSYKNIKSITAEEIKEADDTPFEREVLAKYYNQALSAANISFWFSLVFAAIGFGVIIIAFSTHSPSDPVGTVIKIVSGTIIDAVSGLFFVQSQNARKSMADFFEKLRLDRLSAEARDMIKDITAPEARDQLRMQLVMKFSGIDKLVESDKTRGS